MVQRRKNVRQWIWWGVGTLVVILIVVGVVIGVNISRGGDESGEKSETEMSQEEKKDEGQVEDGMTSDEEAAAAAEEERRQTLQYSGEDANKSVDLTGVVTYAGMNGGTLIIRTSIDQYLTSGTCELTLSRNGAIIYSDTTNIVGSASTATCQGFDVVASGLGGGSVEIVINITADGKSGVIRGEASI